MKALVLTEPGNVSLVNKDVPTLKKGEVLVRIRAAALNHRDQWIRENKYPGIQMGITLGSDGSGVVDKTADLVGEEWIGKEVIINPNIGWGDNPAVQSREYQILGMPRNGTLAEYLSIPVDRLHAKPAHLNFAQAAALPLGGLTAFRALFFHGGLQAGEKVLINGVGGGVAQFAFQFARAAGAEVWVTSGSKEKLDFALKAGAEGGFIYKDQNWPVEAKEKSKGGFQLIIDSAGGDQMNQLIDAMRPAGRLVFYGATTGVPSSLNLRKIFWNQLRLQGSTMGNDQEFKDMLDYVEKHKILPVMEDPLPFEQIIPAMDKMKEGKQLGKLVVTM